MQMTERYSASAPTRAEVDALDGVTLLEFGTDWCGHCRAAQAPWRACSPGTSCVT